MPASIVATIEASKPTRIGLNVGLQQMASPLVGSFMGPLIAIGLLKVLPSWHWVFAVVAIPGIVIAYLLARVLLVHPPGAARFRHRLHRRRPGVTCCRNARYGSTPASMCCLLTCLIVLSAFMPNYLVDHLKLGLDTMGLVLAGFGAGGCLGMVLIPALSDRLGRKPVMIGALAIALATLWILPSLSGSPNGGTLRHALCRRLHEHGRPWPSTWVRSPMPRCQHDW